MGGIALRDRHQGAVMSKPDETYGEEWTEPFLIPDVKDSSGISYSDPFYDPWEQ